jgi:hypothetical protein
MQPSQRRPIERDRQRLLGFACHQRGQGRVGSREREPTTPDVRPEDRRLGPAPDTAARSAQIGPRSGRGRLATSCWSGSKTRVCGSGECAKASQTLGCSSGKTSPANRGPRQANGSTSSSGTSRWSMSCSGVSTDLLRTRWVVSNFKGSSRAGRLSRRSSGDGRAQRKGYGLGVTRLRGRW